MHFQPDRMRVGHQARRRIKMAVGIPRDDRAQLRADRIGVAGNLAQALRGHHPCVIERAAGDGHVVRLRRRRVEQLQQADVRVRRTDLVAQVAQVADLEGLDLDRRRARVCMTGERRQQQIFHRQAERAEMGAVLDLRHEADAPSAGGGFGSGEVDHLLQRDDRPAAVMRGGAPLRQAFARTQGLQLGQGEVLGEPAGHRHAVDVAGCAARGELAPLRHVGGAADLVLVAHHQHAVAAHH